jgi:hypothetical protein
MHLLLIVSQCRRKLGTVSVENKYGRAGLEWRRGVIHTATYLCTVQEGVSLVNVSEGSLAQYLLRISMAELGLSGGEGGSIQQPTSVLSRKE